MGLLWGSFPMVWKLVGNEDGVMEFFWSLRRSRANSRLGGVCGALAARWNTDPLLVRIIAVLVALSGGIGVVLYAACWFLLPREGETQSPLERRSPRAASWSRQTWLVIVAIACAITFVNLASALSIGILPSVIVLGTIWWNRRRTPPTGTAPSNPSGARASSPDPRRRHESQVGSGSTESQAVGYTPLRDPFRGSDTPFTQSARAWQQRVEQAGTEPPRSYPQEEPPPTNFRREETSSGAPQGSSIQPQPTTTSAIKNYLTEPDPVGLYGPATPTVTLKRRFSRAVPLTAALLGAAMLGLFIAQLGGLAVSTPLYWGVALLIFGLSCVINAWRSQAGLRGGRWLAVAAIVASLMAVGANFPVEKPSSSKTELSYSTPAALPATLALPPGEASIDLSELPVSADRTVEVKMKAGSLDITLPDSARVRVVAHSTLGELTVLDQTSEGPNPSLDVTDGQGEATLTLNVTVSFGEVKVDR